MSDLGLLLNVISFLLAVIALLIARAQTRDLRHVSDNLDNVASNLTNIAGGVDSVAGSISTRYSGPFPVFLEQLGDIADSAESELTLVSGNPVPAYFSRPDLYLHYRQAIERAVLRGVDVRVVCTTHDYRLSRLKAEFPLEEPDAWAAWTLQNSELLSAFLRNRGLSDKQATLDGLGFIELLAQAQEDLLNSEFKARGIEVIEINEMIPLQLFVADHTVALVGILNRDPSQVSHGFITYDNQFIDALHSMGELFLTANRPTTADGGG